MDPIPPSDDDDDLRSWMAPDRGAPPSLNDPTLPPPVRAALNCAATIDGLAEEIERWLPSAVAAVRRMPPPAAVVEWFRASFLATAATLELHWTRPGPCASGHDARPFRAKPYLLVYISASATAEYGLNDDLRLMLPGMLSELLVEHELATTLRCDDCRAAIREEIASVVRDHYRSILPSSGSCQP